MYLPTFKHLMLSFFPFLAYCDADDSDYEKSVLYHYDQVLISAKILSAILCYGIYTNIIQLKCAFCLVSYSSGSFCVCPSAG